MEKQDEKKFDGIHRSQPSGPNLKRKHKLLQLNEIDTESYLIQHGLYEFHRLIRDVLQQNPFPSQSLPSTLWIEQTLVNLPLLFLSSIYLYMFAKSKKIKFFLFAQRDCIHWHRIFKILFPSTNTIFFGCSRNMFRTAVATKNQDYFNYIKSQTGEYNLQQTIFIDVYGSGRSMYEYFSVNRDPNGQIPFLFLLSSLSKWENDSSTHSHSFGKSLLQEQRVHVICKNLKTTSLEMLNYDLSGSIVDYKEHHFKRLPIEYDTKYVEIYHQAVAAFLRILPAEISKLETTLNQCRTKDFPFDFYGKLIRHFAEFMLKRPSIALHVPLIRHHPLG